MVIKSDRTGAARSKVTFGTVTVSVRRPTKAEIKHNVDLSSEALRRARDGLIRGSVRLPAKKNVPLFYVDTKNPGQFVRRLNGRVESGVLEDGQFKVID